MTRKLQFAGISVLVGLAGLTGCTGRGAAPTSVLRTEDFIADPATLPTAEAPSPVESTASAPRGTPAPRPIMSVAQARQGVEDLSIKTGAPPPFTAPGQLVLTSPTDSLSLIDAKIGEINGRPIRVDDMFEVAGERLEATAKTRKMSATEWYQSGRRPPKDEFDSPASREDWMALAGTIFRKRLDTILQDEVLTAEARAELSPGEKQGLRYFVREARENRRRAAGGSAAELERQLRHKNQTEGRFSKDIETSVLIESQIQDKFRSRLKTSWKDVRLFYERNEMLYRPPSKARFRIVQVAADNAEGLAAVRAGLAAGQPFAQVAALPANEYKPSEAGLFPDAAFTGSISEGSFFSSTELNAAARGLTPGAATAEPVERVDAASRKTLTWLYLEAVIDNTRPLSDPDVQMEIVRRLEDDAINLAVNTYINRLKKRASFTDIEMMTQTLVNIAAERYWPEGS